jgi:hypothetical protein
MTCTQGRTSDTYLEADEAIWYKILTIYADVPDKQTYTHNKVKRSKENPIPQPNFEDILQRSQD